MRLLARKNRLTNIVFVSKSSPFVTYYVNSSAGLFFIYKIHFSCIFMRFYKNWPLGQGSCSSGTPLLLGPAEQAHRANAGLDIAARLLEPIKEQFPILSHTDFYQVSWYRVFLHQYDSVISDIEFSYGPNTRKVGRPSWLAQSGSVAPTKSWVWILAGTNFCLWIKKFSRCARRKTWPSLTWARVRGFFPRPGEAVITSS